MFIDNINNYPVTDNLIKNFDVVKKEILDYISIPDILKEYPQFKVLNNKDIYQFYWKATPFTLFNGDHKELHDFPDRVEAVKQLVEIFRQKCPVTHSCIKEDESAGFLSNGFISKVIPGTIINPHEGWSKNHIRVHLGLVCDPGCKITTGGETRTWEEGKILAFNDGYAHSVKHEGTQERIILSFDVDYNYLKRYINV